jgi:hypothetical protein
MKSIISLLVLSCYIVVITGGCASLVAADKTSEAIKPSGIHEDCMELLPGQILEYSFEASKPLNFNVHYHEDHDVVYGITKDGVSGDKGTFLCEKKQYYCLMWTNPGSEPVDLVYSYSIKKK